MRWRTEDVAAALGVEGPGGLEFTGISTDTRSLPPGALFVALVGGHFDGHAFLGEAAARGARAAVVTDGVTVPEGLPSFVVHDTLDAYGRLARYRRDRIAGTVVGVTGTNGKTSTKQMLATALGSTWTTHATHANENNLVGVPRTMLSAGDDTEALVVECGTNAPGELERLRRVVAPDIGVVTNVGPGHLEGLGSVEQVITEKVSLLIGAPCGVVGFGSAALRQAAEAAARRVLTAGLESAADMSPDSWSVDEAGRVNLRYRGRELRLPVVGRHQGENAMLALAAVEVAGGDVPAAMDALHDVVLPPGRCQVLDVDGLKVLHDAYNANPPSVQAALDTADRMRGGRPLVVLVGSMLELGDEAARYHRDVAQAIIARRPYLIGAVGEFVPAFEAVGRAGTVTIVTARDPSSLGTAVRPHLRGNEFVLLKASRGVALEQALPSLTPNG